jgi:hypothetical protein
MAGCPSSEIFTIGFYTDSSGLPGTLIQQFNVGDANQTATGNTFGVGFSVEYRYTALFSPVILLPATTYWFAVSNNSGGAIWAWETTAAPGTHAQFGGTSWALSFGNLAFQLTDDGVAGSVPEHHGGHQRRLDVGVDWGRQR